MPKGRTDGLFTAAPLPVAPLDHAERVACLRLIRTPNVGPVAFRELINHCGGAKAALDALPEIARRGGRARPPALFSKARAEAELEAADRIGAIPVFTIEPGYPRALVSLPTPPPLLYIKGRSQLLSRPMLAIVGSRQASAAGHKLTRHFAEAIGEAGLVVVSGLARGIDGTAHEAALATGTVGVLAGGIDIVYPPEHASLQRRIGVEGCLVTEQPPGFQPRGPDFPRRNRIIAGLSLAVLVIEAARRSGTLVTARLAAEYGREVFAVPGHPLDPRAEGTNALLKSGATLVTEPADVLEALAPLTGGLEQRLEEHAADAPAAPELHPPPLLAETERDRVTSLLGPAPVDVDEIARSAGLSIRAVQVVLMELDLAGRIERHGSQLVSLKSKPDED